MSLASLIDRQNLFRDEGKKIIPTALTRADIFELAELIEVKLSPENISCDGERSRAQIRAASAVLFEAQRELAAASADLTAREIFATFTPNEKKLVRLGMFPSAKMEPTKNLGPAAAHAVTCALMKLGGTL